MNRKDRQLAREQLEAQRQQRIQDNLSIKVWPNGWRVYATGSSIPAMHSDLGCVARTPDGRCGFVACIYYNVDGVRIGNGLDFGLWESETFKKSEVRIIGLVAIPDSKGNYIPQRI